MQSLKLAIIFPLSFLHHTSKWHIHKAPLGNQSERNTSCVDSLISDKPNLKGIGIERAWEFIEI